MVSLGVVAARGTDSSQGRVLHYLWWMRRSILGDPTLFRMHFLTFSWYSDEWRGTKPFENADRSQILSCTESLSSDPRAARWGKFHFSTTRRASFKHSCSIKAIKLSNWSRRELLNTCHIASWRLLNQIPWIPQASLMVFGDKELHCDRFSIVFHCTFDIVLHINLLSRYWRVIWI